MALLLFGTGATACASQGLVASSAQDRALVEAKVHSCGLAMKNVRWTRIEALEQWELGFETEPAHMKDPKISNCINGISNELGRRHSDVMIAYTAPKGLER